VYVSKTALTDILSYLLVSVGSSTFQLHDSLGSRRACLEAGFSSSIGDRVWGAYYRKAALCCAFFELEKRLNAKDIHKVIFRVHCGKFLSRKAVHNWVEKFSQGRSNVADDARPGAELAKTIIKRLLCGGFRHVGNAMGQVYQCSWRIFREINVLLLQFRM
jgi:hypothetical protein